MDSTQETESTVANGEVSENVGQPNSLNADSSDLEKVLNRLERLEQKLDDPKRIQSEKDKVFSALEKDKRFKLLEGYKEIRKLQEEGYTDREIEQELRIREMEDSKVAQNSTGSAVQDDKLKTAKVLAEALGLELNDPDVLQVMLKGDTEQPALKLSELAMRRKSEPNPAIVAQTSGGSKSPGLMDEYRQRLAKVRRGDVNTITELKMEFRKKGLDIN